MLLADFADYCRIQQVILERYKNVPGWYKSSGINIAGAGAFAADRSVSQYAENIWGIQVQVPGK
jgi:starch phosphorylase